MIRIEQEWWYNKIQYCRHSVNMLTTILVIGVLVFGSELNQN